MILSPIEFLVGLLVTAFLMVGAARLFKTTAYRGVAGAVGMLVGLMVVELVAKARYGEAYPTSASWVVMRTVLGSGLGIVACYVWRESRHREWAAAAGMLVGLAMARLLFF